MQKIREEVVAVLKKAALDMKKHYDDRRQDTSEYQIGDRAYSIWMAPTLQQTYP